MDMMKTALRELKKLMPELEVRRSEPMRDHCSFRIGGPVSAMAFPRSAEECEYLVQLLAGFEIEPLVIGNGTNLLVSDEPMDMFVIKTCDGMGEAELLDETTLRAGAGITLSRLAVFAREHGLTGLEFAHGIPGSLGGGVVMNAGAYGGELKDVLTEVTALFPDGVRTLRAQELALGYRRSIFTDHPEAVVLRAKLKLTRGEPETIKARMEELASKRRASQPLELPSAGSTFKRPEGYFAGTLIDQCGLKGTRVGGAEVSVKHAGFVVNVGGATCADVSALIALVQEKVFAATGVRLEPEVKRIG